MPSELQYEFQVASHDKPRDVAGLLVQYLMNRKWREVDQQVVSAVQAWAKAQTKVGFSADDHTALRSVDRILEALDKTQALPQQDVDYLRAYGTKPKSKLGW